MGHRRSLDDTEIEKKLLVRIRSVADRIKRPVRLMEVCGTHTMTIFRAGLPALLPSNVRLLSGPGCPVCVTPMGYLDAAILLSQRPDVTLATFGDMVRVPGSESSLERERARGADVRVVYSPMDALHMAREDAGRKVVFLAVGFETTAPATAVTVGAAVAERTDNFLILSAHKLVPPALRVLLADEGAALDGLILPGHVSAILGLAPYRFIAEAFGRAGAIAGFEPADVLQAILMLLTSIADERPRVENKYTRVVPAEGNAAALRQVERYFETGDAEWRGLGQIPASGLRLREEFGRHDAAAVLGVTVLSGREPAGCRCGDVLRGLVEPEECGLFGKRCKPATPVGACMVSSEGTCAAHYTYGGRKL